MGFLDEIKKAIFGAKSVGKSKAGKAAEQTRTKISDIVEDGKESLDKYSDQAEDMLKKYEESETGQKVKHTIDEVKEETSESIERIKDVTEDFGEKILDASADLLEKGMEKTEKLYTKSKEAYARSDMDEKVDAAKDKAKDVVDNLKSKFDETMERAQRAAADEKNKQNTPYESSDKAKDALKNTSFPDEKDDFWSKAEAYAEGRYEDVRDTGAIDIVAKDPTDEQSNLEKKVTPLPQYEDRDGDGNEIVDNAELLEEE